MPLLGTPVVSPVTVTPTFVTTPLTVQRQLSLALFPIVVSTLNTQFIWGAQRPN